MHGNAQEWCLDWYAPYNPSDTKDPLGKAGNSRVIRGGAFCCWGRLLRSANRSSMLQDIIRGAPTEIDAICGAVVRTGEEHGIPTPFNWTMWQLVRALYAS